MPDWVFWLETAFVLGAVIWSGWNVHHDAWWLGRGFLIFWYVAAPLAIGGMVALWVIHYG